MSNKVKAALCIGVLVLAFATGRYTAPLKTKTETKTAVDKHEVEDITSKQEKHKETVKTEVIKPDGTKEITTKTTEDTHKQTNSTDTTQTNRTKVETKEVMKEGSRYFVSALIGTTISSSGLQTNFGGHVAYRLVGPVSLGVFGFTDGRVGGSVGISF